MKAISELLRATTARALPVVRAVTADKLTAPTPCPEYDVRALINHLLHVVVNFQALAAKKDSDFSTTPDRTAGDWQALFADETSRLVEAWAGPGAEEGTTGSLGLPARTVGFMVLGDLTVHAWDLARATGQRYDPDPDVVAELGPAVEAMAPMAREWGAFGEAVRVPADASVFARVLATTGRDPGWSPR
ncbi:TIGR03086 family metal-binding protein [Streptomyces sp. NBC_01619]|uniref:TIGR03086 family metal-binding protein n=1 Tax=Streptomyces pratisoli TaxID=3139917 RepID=A0ACC6QL68_9ACTN|nr:MULTISPECIES: TIGR03086 family metal-binding protein [unclassified Streptomyces]MCX4512498.1 TIGR03086 family metal-binding protein [Streptomyces sp. NBC_01619]